MLFLLFYIARAIIVVPQKRETALTELMAIACVDNYLSGNS